MAKMLVVVQTGEPEKTAGKLLSQMPSSTLPEGVTQLHATAWTIELPKCSEFFAILLCNAKADDRTYVVAELAEGIDPLSS